MFKQIVFLLFCVFSTSTFAQNVPAGFDLSNFGVRIEPDKRVMIVLATLEAARTTNEAGEQVPVINTTLSAEGSKFRELLKSDLAALSPNLRQRISTFVIQYKQRNPKASDAELVTPFVSMAYALSSPPDLADPVVTADLPGNLLDVLDFAPLVRDFYRRSSFSANLDDYVKGYQKTADGQLRISAREMVSDLLTYMQTRPQIFYSEKITTETQKGKSKNIKLKNVETRERERRFFIVPEMLAPVGNVTFVNIKDDYYVVVPPDSNLSFSEVRRGFLQFVIDPLVLNNSKDIATVRESVKTLLDERRKVDPKTSPDVYLTISRSLVAAIDAKQAENAKAKAITLPARQRIESVKTDAEKRAISQELEKLRQGLADETALRLSEEYENGAILAFYFADQLKGVEDSGFDIASSMREMILSFDAAKETGRLAQHADARKRAIVAREERKKSPAGNAIVENPVVKRLVEIQKTIDAKNYVQASSDLNKLLSSNPVEAPRIYYNIGRVASLSAESLTEIEQQKAKLLEAKVAFENVIRLSEKQQVDPALRSLSYVALAKIYEFYDEKGYAMSVYEAAIRLGNVVGGAHDEAVAAKARLLKDQ